MPYATSPHLAYVISLDSGTRLGAGNTRRSHSPMPGFSKTAAGPSGMIPLGFSSRWVP